MTITDHIEINPKVMMGTPVIRGTRIPVELILRKLAEGASEADLLDAYPRLTREAIQAAIGYAADTVAHEETVLLKPKGVSFIQWINDSSWPGAAGSRPRGRWSGCSRRGSRWMSSVHLESRSN
jgi:uncharacterized protein (DUF433 family)